MTPPDVGPDGVVYYSASTSRIIALNSGTLTPNWQYQDGTIMYHPTVSPLNDMVVTGGVVTFGDVGFIKAISAGSGQLLWTVPLPGAFYPEPRVVPVHHPRFTPDGNTVYVSTTILAGSDTDPHSFLYAIATGADSTTDVNENTDIGSFQLFENYPNPFNPATTIRFEIPQSGFVSLKVFDVLGRDVATLVNEERSPGIYSVRWDATNFGSGTYFCKLENNSRREVRKMLLMK